MLRRWWDWLEDDENFKLVIGGTWVLMLLYIRLSWMLLSGDPVEPHPVHVGPPPLPPPLELTWSERLMLDLVIWFVYLVFVFPALPALWIIFRRVCRYVAARRR